MGGFSTAVPGPITQGYNINPPAVDPLANLRALAMQGQIAEQKQNIATQQQAMGTTALNQQILQQQLDDQKALVQTFKDGVDPNKPDDIINGIIKNGGSGPTAIKFVQEIANTRKINAQTDIDTLNAQKQREDHYRATVEGITKLPPEQQQVAWNEHRQEILSVDPGASELYPGNDLAMARANTHGLQSQLIEEEQKRRETEKNIAQTTQAAAETEKLNLINQRLKQGAHVVKPGEPHPIDGIFPASLDPAQNQYFKAAYDTGANFVNPTTGISELQEAIVKQASEAASKIREAQNPQIIAGEAKKAAARAVAETPAMVNRQVEVRHALETLTPDQTRLAQGIADYRVAPIGGFALSRPENRGVMAAAMAINPEYREENYEAYRRTENDAATGNIAKQTTAARTVLGHFSTLSQAADALKNNNIQILNQIANTVGAQVGTTPKTTYDTIVHRIGPEITKAYVASGGRADERGANEEDFASKLGPDQIKNNIGVSAHLLETKMDALQEQYNQGTFGRGQRQLLNPQDRQAIQSLTNRANTPAVPKGGVIYARDPSGKLHRATAGTPLPQGWKPDKAPAEAQ